MIEIKKDNFVYYQFENFNNYKSIKHFITTRTGGVSNKPYNSLNLGLKTKDNKDMVKKNYKILADAIGIGIENFVIQYQCHSMNIKVVDETYKCKDILKIENKLIDNDAMITNKKNVCLLVFGADCVPVILYDTVKNAIGVCHAGWKGTINKIVNKTIEKMRIEYNSDAENIIAGIGPSIGPCCYEIKDDVINEIQKVYSFNNNILINNKHNTYLDLWKANKVNLLEAGVKENNISVSELCTYCKHDLFFSHRHSKGITGRFASGIMLQ